MSAYRGAMHEFAAQSLMAVWYAHLDVEDTLTTFKSQLKAINIDIDIVAQEPGTFATNNGAGNFEWGPPGPLGVRPAPPPPLRQAASAAPITPASAPRRAGYSI